MESLTNSIGMDQALLDRLHLTSLTSPLIACYPILKSSHESQLNVFRCLLFQFRVSTNT